VFVDQLSTSPVCIFHIFISHVFVDQLSTSPVNSWANVPYHSYNHIPAIKVKANFTAIAPQTIPKRYFL
jgi:hypothetical protein